MRLTALTIAASLALLPLTGPAQSQSLENLDRETLRGEIRAYLLENPEVIFEAIQILEERRAAEARNADRQVVAQHAEALFNDGFSWVGGNPDGDITVVEFLDYRCGFCKRAHPEVKALLERDPNIRLIIKEFPILGPESVTAGRVALAALKLDPGKYADLNDAMMGYRGNLTEQVVYRLASDSGFDIAALKSGATSAEVDEKLARNYRLAQSLGVEGTPAFVIGTEVVRGYLPVDDLATAVAEARAQAAN